MRSIWLVVLLMLPAATACSKDDTSTKEWREKSSARDGDGDDKRADKKRDRRDDTDDLVDDVTAGIMRYTDEACACTSADCAESVHKRFRDWRKDMKSKLKTSDKPSESVLKRITELQKKYDDCRKAHRTEAKPPP